uniref:Uncharacterized protein n=1 Tax=viral metagenome TaxID=1070528 RepID=A0A6H1ZJI2_9ZZZZ
MTILIRLKCAYCENTNPRWNNNPEDLEDNYLTLNINKFNCDFCGKTNRISYNPQDEYFKYRAIKTNQLNQLKPIK